VIEQDLSQILVLVEYPRLHGRDEGVAADELHLQGQDAEQQVAVGARL
jgi:hypothetical protein